LERADRNIFFDFLRALSQRVGEHLLGLRQRIGLGSNVVAVVALAACRQLLGDIIDAAIDGAAVLGKCTRPSDKLACRVRRSKSGTTRIAGARRQRWQR
jgi:hypothetical protein